jgi:hypothetical protein
MEMLECPSISETIFGCTPLVRRSIAHVCLRCGPLCRVDPYVEQPVLPQERLEGAPTWPKLFLLAGIALP